MLPSWGVPWVQVTRSLQQTLRVRAYPDQHKTHLLDCVCECVCVCVCVCLVCVCAYVRACMRVYLCLIGMDGWWSTTVRASIKTSC